MSNLEYRLAFVRTGTHAITLDKTVASGFDQTNKPERCILQQVCVKISAHTCLTGYPLYTFIYMLSRN